MGASLIYYAYAAQTRALKHTTCGDYNMYRRVLTFQPPETPSINPHSLLEFLVKLPLGVLLPELVG